MSTAPEARGNEENTSHPPPSPEMPPTPQSQTTDEETVLDREPLPDFDKEESAEEGQQDAIKAMIAKML